VTDETRAVRVEVTVPRELYDRMEAARGLVPRAAWIKHLIERELEEPRGAR
jgi:hypothetical protein